MKPIFDDDKKGLLLNGLLNAELQRKTLELQDYVENASIALHWIDEHGIIKWANKAELDMLGYTEDEYIGHHISKFHVDQRRINEILTLLACNETLNGYEATLRRKDGGIKTVRISSNVFLKEGKFVHTRCFTIDITEQKKLFESLKESENRYKTLVNGLPAALYTCDKNGQITYFNDRAVELWGYRPLIDNNLTKFCAFYKVWLPDGTFLPPEETPMALALKTGKSFKNVQATVERPDASSFFASVNVEPLINENGDIVGAINVFQDITAIKKAEQSLAESESRYREVINALAAPLYTTDIQGRITLYNQAAVELWGREPTIGKDLWCGSYRIRNVDGSDLPLADCPMAVCLREGRPISDKEIIVVRPDGTTRHVAPRPQPLFDAKGKMTGAINLLMDITEIKLAEEALRHREREYRLLSESLEKKVEENTFDLRCKNQQLKASEERYHKMIEEVEDYAIILLDSDGIVQNWNRGAEKIKGYMEQEIVGESFAVFYLDEDRKNNLPFELLKRARQLGKCTHEGWRQRKDGSRFWGSVVLTALHNEDDKVIGFTKVTRDLTATKLSEDRLLEYSKELEFQNRELEQFAYAASHDLKEPLRKIQMYYSALEDEPANILTEKSREYLKRSTSAALRMSRLIEDLLTYSKAASHTDTYEEVDLQAVIAEIVEHHRDDLTNAQVMYNCLPTVFGIGFQLKQLFQNIISNSIKYKHPKRDLKISVSYELVEKAFEVGLAGNMRYHKISIQDNGIGFDQKYVDKIFDLFQRLSNASGGNGSGVGLALCKRIIQNHDGVIRAKGIPDEGAHFDCYLPTARSLPNHKSTASVSRSD